MRMVILDSTLALQKSLKDSVTVLSETHQASMKNLSQRVQRAGRMISLVLALAAIFWFLRKLNKKRGKLGKKKGQSIEGSKKSAVKIKMEGMQEYVMESQTEQLVKEFVMELQTEQGMVKIRMVCSYRWMEHWFIGGIQASSMAVTMRSY